MARQTDQHSPMGRSVGDCVVMILDRVIWNFNFWPQKLRYGLPLFVHRGKNILGGISSSVKT
jgi:hypothetical protein